MELPHTAGCLVCGRQNPIGLHLHLHVEESTGAVETHFTPAAEHIGFEGIIHGGILATVCPADKKLLHGMPDAVMAPCRVEA